MNILPKKSWHVLSRKNIERVRRDEAQAKAEEEEKAHRAAHAEQEARLGVMKKRARERDEGEERREERGGRGREGDGRKQRRKECSVTDASGHINFFTDVQKGVGLQVGNAERERENKQEQEKLEKRIGLLNYLVDKDKADNEPWYVKSAGKREAEKEEITSGVGSGLGVGSGAGSGSGSAEVKRKSAKAEHRKELQDPLLSMKHYVTAKKKKEGLAVEGGVAAYQRQTHSTGSRRSHGTPHVHVPESLKPDTHDKSKHKHKRKHRHSGDGDEKKGSSSAVDVERLRRERRRREEGERARAEALMRGLDGGGGKGGGGGRGRGGVGSVPLAVEQVHGRYNNQFNPHLTRQQ